MYEIDMLETHTYVALTHADERSRTSLEFQAVQPPSYEIMAGREAVDEILGVCDALLSLDCFSVANTLEAGTKERAQHWKVQRQGTLIGWTRGEILRIFGGAVCSAVEGSYFPQSTDTIQGCTCLLGKIYTRKVQEQGATLELRCLVSTQLSYEEFVAYTSQRIWQGDQLCWSCGSYERLLMLSGVSRGFSTSLTESLTSDFLGKVAALHFSR